MNKVIANTSNEWQKLLATKKTIVLLAVSFVIPLLFAWLLTSIQAKFGVNIGDTTQFMMFVVGIFTSILLPLFGSITAIDIFTGEVQSNTMKWILVRPITRWKVYVSKVVSLALYLVAHLAVIWVSASLASAFIGKGAWLAGVGSGLLALTVSLLPMLMFVLLIALIAQLFKNSSTALVVGIFVYLASVFVPVWVPQAAIFAPTTYFSWYQQWMGSAGMDIRTIRSLLYLLSAGSLFFTLGFTMFDKREY